MMSQVTNVILCCALYEGEAIDYINETFNLGVHFESEGNFCAGDKNLEVSIHLGAFNYLRLPLLVKAITEAHWSCPECVQLLIKGQEDDKFHEVPTL